MRLPLTLSCLGTIRPGSEKGSACFDIVPAVLQIESSKVWIVPAGLFSARPSAAWRLSEDRNG